MTNQTARVDEIEIKENIRQEFGEKELKEMADSIKLYGIIVPLVVRKTGNKLVLVDGERRLRAAKIIGLGEVPITFATGKMKDDEMKQLITAIHRKNLSSLELARYYKKLAENMTQSDIAKIVCKTQAHISQILKLNDISKYQKEKIKNGESYAKVLAKHSPNYQDKSGEKDYPDITPVSGLPPSEGDISVEQEQAEIDGEEILNFAISAASTDRIAQELKVKLEEIEFDGTVRITLKISKLKDEDIERALTDDGVYGFFDDAGNFTELT